ncbi:MAG: hypothetical protein ABIE70_08335 [bacterium]
MEKEVSSVRVIETDDGFRIEVKGKQLKDMCCLPGLGRGFAMATCCCPPAKTDGGECCAEDKKK